MTEWTIEKISFEFESGLCPKLERTEKLLTEILPEEQK